MKLSYKITHSVIFIAVILLCAYDILALLLWGVDSTISVRITGASKMYPIIPFAFGFLMGHFFAQNKV